MFAQIPFMPEQASTTARSVDALFLFVGGITAFMAILVAVLVIFFAVHYRRRGDSQATPRILGSLKLELFWTITPAFFFLAMFVWGAGVYFAAYRPPDDAGDVYVVAKQWMWKMQHPEGQREINELHVPVDVPVKLMLTSEDVIHSFFVPAFRIHMDVIPGRYTRAWFQATKPGTYHLFCSQYCGTNHAGMIGTVIVMKQADYQEWLAQRAEGSMALEGRKIFLKYRCISCHSADGQARAPVLEELFGKRVLLRDGHSVIADEPYIRESILAPGAKIVAGYENIMPTFQGQVSEEEVLALIAWLKTLERGQTPPRVEESAPPQKISPEAPTKQP
jgi:cytochrome c oxidase subunit 2